MASLCQLLIVFSPTRPRRCKDTSVNFVWTLLETHRQDELINAHTHLEPKKVKVAAISAVWYHPENAKAQLKCGTCLWCESRAWACNKRRYQITSCPALISKMPCSYRGNEIGGVCVCVFQSAHEGFVYQQLTMQKSAYTNMSVNALKCVQLLYVHAAALQCLAAGAEPWLQLACAW